MNNRNFISRSLAGVALLAAPSLGLAQVTSVIVGPASAADTAIPTLTENMLIVLGLLLAIVAVRALRSQRGKQKFLSLILFGSGLVVGGIGVERSIASADTVIAMGGVCAQAGPINYDPAFFTSLSNGCTVDIEIRSFSSEACPLDEGSASCTRGLVMAPGESCDELPRCDFPE